MRRPPPSTRQPADAGSPTGSGRSAAPWPALTVLAAAQCLVVLTTSIVNVALPAVSTGLELGPAGLSWVINAYVLAFGALLLLGGRLGDVYGRRRIFLIGTAIFTAGTATAGLAAGPAVLIAARGVQGLGAALLAPTALGLVLGLFPAGAGRSRAIGVWGAVTGAGGAAGVLLSGALTNAFGWRAVFLAGVPMALAVLIGGRLRVPADAPTGGRIDVTGAVTGTTGLVALTYGLTGAGGTGWGSPGVYGPILAGVVLLGGFAVLQTRVGAPLVRPGIFRADSVLAANVLMTLLGAVWLSLFFFLPLYQQRVLGYSPMVAGLSQLPLAATITVFSALTPRIGVSPRVLLPSGLGVLAAGLLWLSRAPVDGSFLPDLAGPSLMIGVGLGTAFVLLTQLSAAGVPAADSGLAGGLINTSRQIGGALGLAVLTTVASTAPGAPVSALADAYGAALAAAAGIAAVTALLALPVGTRDLPS